MANRMKATRHEIDCVTRKKGPRHPYHQISHIGGTNPDRTRWQLTEAVAIEVIENHLYKFYVLANGRQVEVMIAIRNGKKYLKTVADADEPEGLLGLPECD